MGLRNAAAVLLFLLATGSLSHPARAQLLPAASDSVRLLGRLMTQPQKAAVLSAVLPGAGQVYNRQYWKLPLVGAAIGGAVYAEVRYWHLYQEYRRGYQARQRRAQGDATAADTGPRSGRESSDTAQQQQFYRYRTARDTWAGVVALTYGLNIVDAVVGAHLRSFDVGDSLSLRVRPTLLPLPVAAAPGLAFSFTPSLGSR